MNGIFEKISQKIIDKLGGPVHYFYESGDQTVINGVFDYAYIQAFEHTSRQPILTVSSEEITPNVGDKVLISGDYYKIVSVEPDGIGVTMCNLVLL